MRTAVSATADAMHVPMIQRRPVIRSRRRCCDWVSCSWSSRLTCARSAAILESCEDMRGTGRVPYLSMAATRRASSRNSSRVGGLSGGRGWLMVLRMRQVSYA